VLVRADMIIAADLGFIEEIQATAATPVDWKICRPLSPILRKCWFALPWRGAAAIEPKPRLLDIHHQLLYTKIKRYGPDPCDQNSAN
jgi:hypothetical protein